MYSGLIVSCDLQWSSQSENDLFKAFIHGTVNAYNAVEHKQTKIHRALDEDLPTDKNKRNTEQYRPKCVCIRSLSYNLI